MKYIRTLFTLILLIQSISNFAQGGTGVNDLSYLQGQKKVYLKFNYDQLKVEDIWSMRSIWRAGNLTELKTEQEFLSLKEKRYEKKNQGHGKQWVKQWEWNKRYKFESQFQKNFNKKKKLRADRFADSLKYTVQVNVLEIRLGGSGGPAICSFEVLIFETTNPTKILTQLQLFDEYKIYPFQFPGITPIDFVGSLVTGTFPSSYSKRVKDTYAKAGKDLAKILCACAVKEKADTDRFIDW